MDKNDWNQDTLDVAFDALVELTDYSSSRDNPDKIEETNRVANRIRSAVLAGWVSVEGFVAPAKHCLERAWVRGAAHAMFQVLLQHAAHQRDTTLLRYLLDFEVAQGALQMPSLPLPLEFLPLIVEKATTQGAQYRYSACMVLSEEERRRGVDLRPFEGFLFAQLGQKGPKPRVTVGGQAGWVIAEQIYKGKDPDGRWRARLAELSQGKDAVALDALHFHARLSTFARSDSVQQLLALRGPKLEAVVQGIDAAQRVDRSLMPWVAPQLATVRPTASAKVQKLIDEALARSARPKLRT